MRNAALSVLRLTRLPDRLTLFRERLHHSLQNAPYAYCPQLCTGLLNLPIADLTKQACAFTKKIVSLRLV